MATPQLSASSKALHWSAITDPRVASDITGAGAWGDFFGEPIPEEQIYGAALGTPGASTHSGYGIFTDDNGNTICIATESRDAWGLISRKQLLGKDPYTFNLERNMGSGGAFEANALMLIGGNGRRFNNYPSWIAIEDAERNKIPGLTLQPYNDFPGLLSQIEQTGRKFDRPIVILSSGEPVTIASVLSKALSVILTIAKPFASLIGIPPVAFDLISQSLNVIATQGRFTVDMLADAAQLIVPANYRSLLSSAKNVYANINTGNYLGAMEGLGVVGNVLGVKDSLLKGDISALLGKSKLPYSDMIGKVQNLFQMQTVRDVSAATRSGSVISNLIDAGTMTKVPILQNLLCSTTTDTLASAIPGVSEIFQKAINETNDITNVDLHKGAIQTAIGHPVGPDIFDDLGLRGQKERANEMLEKGIKQYVMPIIIPAEKRNEWAQIIANEIGITVVADAKAGTKATPKTLTQAWY